MRRTTLTLEKWAYLQHLREASSGARRISYELPYVTPDVASVMHWIVMHPEKVSNKWEEEVEKLREGSIRKKPKRSGGRGKRRS